MSEPKKVFVKTYGCQMNVYDSERMADTLAPRGWSEAKSAEEADLVILNTCHIREKAAEKVYSELGRLRVLKGEKAERGEKLMVGVAGCVAQAEGVEIARRAPVVDMVFGPQSYHRLPEIIDRADNGSRVVETEFPVEDKFDHLAPASREKTVARGLTAFLTVQEGCDKFCTFCVVPYTRGVETSRPVDRVLAEARRLAEAGVREVTLLGQNVNGYHGAGPGGDAWSLARLVRALAEIPGLDRIRYTTSHPRDMSDDLVEAHRDLPQLMPWLHLPVQSGSDRILAAMNRRHVAADYLRLVERIRAARPDIAMSGDFIVGFPGETEADFQALLDWLTEAKLDRVGAFKYEAVKGAVANDLPGAVPEAVKQERWDRLMAHQQAIAARIQKGRVGRRVPVIVDEVGPTVAKGRTKWDAPEIDGTVHIASHRPLRAGEIVTVKIEAADAYDLKGTAVG